MIEFEWKGRKYKAYNFSIGGEDMVSICCPLVDELAIIQEIGLETYPYCTLLEFETALTKLGYPIVVFDYVGT